MKVLYFMNHADHGGAVLALYDLIVELKKISSDYYPIVITGKKNKLNDMLSDIGVENYYADFKNFLSSYKSPYFITHAALWLRYEIGKRKGINEIESLIDFSEIDVIHSNLDRIDIGALFAQKYSIPHIWHIREHTKIYTGVLVPKAFESEETETDFNLVSIKNNPVKYMNSFCNGRNYFIAISKSVKQVWVKKGIASDRIQLIYDGIRHELFDVNNREHLLSNSSEDKVKIVFLGGYCKEKGQEEFIQVLKKISPSILKKLQVDFYGSGDSSYIQKIAKPLVDSGIVRINAYVPDIYKRLNSYDVGINCSSAEGFGRVTVEYMLAGLCPLVSNRGANTELVEDRLNGIIYEKGNCNDLVEKTAFLVSNPEIIHKYGLAARNRAIKLFTMSKHANAVMQLYLDVLGENKND